MRHHVALADQCIEFRIRKKAIGESGNVGIYGESGRMNEMADKVLGSLSADGEADGRWRNTGRSEFIRIQL